MCNSVRHDWNLNDEKGQVAEPWLRPHSAANADSLTAALKVIAINLQAVAAANNYWR
ncbi:MAG TPA: hexameric tyrosine-coordinated heme protein [Microbacteriaceae bacterium]|nr:hexameric tyrosine-coordinated heme protein [Microbacteriaceae bacterium]